MLAILIFWLALSIEGAIIPPPWADPSSNPCAAEPRGWQLLFWPPDGKCYKIFRIGAPCPETMELGPTARGQGAECRCPPGTAQSSPDSKCWEIFTQAECPEGEYFAPVDSENSSSRQGICQKPGACDRGKLFWPRSGSCFEKLTRGPCPKGQLLTSTPSGLVKCDCDSQGELGPFFHQGQDGGCYEHFTSGPCSEPGEIFLPDGRCGCRPDLPHFHPESGLCFPLGTLGPCKLGQEFVGPTGEEKYGTCACKPGHVLFSDGRCYRKWTRGPCEPGNMLENSTACIPIPCKRGRLFFPQERTCYRIGTRGPCKFGQVVLFDQNVRPSVDGVGYNGVCGCPKAMKAAGKCREAEPDGCEAVPGMFLVERECHRLYSQGPCGLGEWLVARRQPRGVAEAWAGLGREFGGKVACECRPGYSRVDKSDVDTNVLGSVPGECQPPAVGLANYLNRRYGKFGGGVE